MHNYFPRDEMTYSVSVFFPFKAHQFHDLLSVVQSLYHFWYVFLNGRNPAVQCLNNVSFYSLPYVLPLVKGILLCTYLIPSRIFTMP